MIQKGEQEGKKEPANPILKQNDNHSSAKDAASSRARKGNPCYKTFIDDDEPEGEESEEMKQQDHKQSLK